MGADNWTTCPRCLQRAQKEYDDICEKFGNAYGKVPEPEYNELATRVDEGIRLPEQTLREDYHLRLHNDGTFLVSYSAHCTVCGFTHKFKHEEKLQLQEDADET